MPTNQSVTLVKGTIPPGLCFSNIPELYNTFVDTTTAYVNGNYSLFNFGNSTPSADDNDKPWVRTDGDGRPDKMYVYKDGYWICKHPTPASGKERRIWTGTDTELLSYEADGNSSSTATIYSGPFWEVDTTMVPEQTSNKEYTADIYDTETIAAFASNTSSNNWQINQTHSLGELPDKVGVTILCIADDSDLGYVAGDEIDVLGGYCNIASSQGELPYLRFAFDETQVTLMVAPQVQTDLERFYLPQKDTGSGASEWQRIGGAAGGAKYKFRIRVWKKGGKSLSTSSTNFSYIKRTARVYYTA
jgi:hypothetical protein